MRNFSGKLCYLCGKVINSNSEGDKDHVPPKGIFSGKVSGNLITVPTHKVCNNKYSKIDETFRALIMMTCSINSNKANELYKDKVRKSFKGEKGKGKKHYFTERFREEVKTDQGELIKGPMILIEPDNLISQFQRITRGIFCHKMKIPLPSESSIEIHFKSLEGFSEFSNPNWIEVEKDIFRYFFYTQEGYDTKGVAGLVFYETLFCIVFF